MNGPRPGRGLVPLLSLCALLAGCGGADRRPSVLLITVDTLRADRLSAYGCALPTTPAVDRLAAEGVRFADCTVQWPKTWPSMASLMTGEYPRTTGVRLERRILPDSMTMLADCFHDAGYATAAVVTNLNLGRTFGFGQGFDTYQECWSGAASLTDGSIAATAVTDRALAWLAEAGDGPWFLWLHYMDPHGPYTPPAEFADRFVDAHAPEPVPLGELPPYQVQEEDGAPIHDLAHYRRQYDREVLYLDGEVGRLLEGVRERAPDALVAFTADHGESLGEHHYYLEHGLRPYQECARVPLILRQDGVLPAGAVRSEPVGLIDLSPTLLELVGIPVPATFEGESLVDLAQGRPGATGPAHVFMESGGGAKQPQLSVREGPWKLVWVSSPRDQREMTGAEVELYDLAADPGEAHNVAADHPDLVGRLLPLVQSWVTEVPPGRPQAEPLTPGALDPDTLRILQELGYGR